MAGVGRSSPKVLVINPGSTSTKIAVFVGARCRFETELKHDPAALSRLDNVLAQDTVRRQAILTFLAGHKVNLRDIDVFIGRGGLLRPLDGGIYAVNDAMIADLRSCRHGEHASNLGAILAAELAGSCDKVAHIANPVVVDELSDVARLSGHPDLRRRSIFHALSHKAVAQKVARRLGKTYERCNLVVAHLGGGITIGAHEKGRVVDVTNALDGEGPMTPERAGAVAALTLYRYGLEHNLTLAAAQKMMTRGGGLLAHLGTNDCRQIEEKVAAGDAKYTLVYNAFIYQVAKSIGAMAAALSGRVDAVVLTGGVVRSRIFVQRLRGMVKFIAPVIVVVENSEMAALAAAAVAAHSGAEEVKAY